MVTSHHSQCATTYLQFINGIRYCDATCAASTMCGQVVVPASHLQVNGTLHVCIHVCLLGVPTLMYYVMYMYVVHLVNTLACIHVQLHVVYLQY